MDGEKSAILHVTRSMRAIYAATHQQHGKSDRQTDGEREGERTKERHTAREEEGEGEGPRKNQPLHACCTGEWRARVRGRADTHTSFTRQHTEKRKTEARQEEGRFRRRL
mmetsp:Transcript_20166/g.48947  ORF Transcript_20166/g.48947 Transcript_20166/m.48947 type:complete len:110 (-) Transcript_20166:2918-3247(-)